MRTFVKSKPRTSLRNGPFCSAIARSRRNEGKPDIHCRKVAGWGTDHLGEGRCKFHGGCTPYKHGRYSSLTHGTIKKELEKLEQFDRDPLDLMPDLNLARAMLMDFVQRYDQFAEALMAWHESYKVAGDTGKPTQILDIADASGMIEKIARIVSIVNKMTEEGSIPLETFKRLQEQMAIVVASNVQDMGVLKKIELEWGQIRIDRALALLPHRPGEGRSMGRLTGWSNLPQCRSGPRLQ